VARVQVAVIGSGREHEARAEEVGRLLAERGCTVVTGGLGEVMAAASRGAKAAGGATIGILPGERREDANEWIDHVVVTGIGHARNLAVVGSGDAVIAVGGSWGTLAEIGFASRLGRKVVILEPGLSVEGIPRATSPAEAVDLVLGAPASALHATAAWSESGEGEQLWFLGTLATIRVSGEASEGRFALIEFLFPRHASPPLHTHPQDESYVVLEGRLTVQAGDERFELTPGAAAVVPMRVAHTFRVDSDTARVLVLSTPAGLERMVRDASVPAAAPTLPPSETPRPSPEELESIFRAHGQANVGPSLAPDD
jgi:uncharacterized protein (TIGR00725 family)